MHAWLRTLGVLCIMAFSLCVHGQSGSTLNLANVPVIDDELSTDFFVKNRQRLRDTMPDSSIVFVFSSPLKVRSNDIDYRYHQDPDFYYFTGVREPNGLLIITKDSHNFNGFITNELLFVESKNAKKEQWSGKMIGVEGASEISGVSHVLPNTEFKPMVLPLARMREVLSNKLPFIEKDDREHPGDLMSLSKHFDAKVSRAGLTVKVNEAEDLFSFLRQLKSEEEIKMLQQAIDVTCKAHIAAIEAIEPGMAEYEVEALVNYTFRKNGADGEAFPSIIASGENGGIMHYTDNASLLIPGDLVIMDIGAQYEGYAADITRTVPVSGKFSEEQAIIYQIVLDAQTVAIRYSTPGYKFWTPHDEAYRTIGKGLIKHGIIDKWSDIGKYFIHGTSHYLGLDVHDAGVYSALKPGEVITIEPGIYIPAGSPCDPKWWNIFIRIEDDILITDGPAKVLSQGAPKSITEIEEMMAKRVVDQ